MRLQKMKISAISFAVILLFGTAAFAATPTTTAPTGAPMAGPPMPMPPPMNKNPALEAAIKTCADSVGKDSSGHPDHAAMKTCMTAKGFPPPEHGPGGPQGGQQGGPPPMNGAMAPLPGVPSAGAPNNAMTPLPGPPTTK